MPKVTVAIPVYNDAAYLAEALDSIFAQRLQDFELLIVDDGSTDATAEIVASYTDPRLRIIRFAQNKGRPFARNAALEAAQGEYFAWMDGDDMSLPQRLQRQVDFLDAHPALSVCGCALQCVHERQDIVRMPSAHQEILAGIVWEPTVPNAASCMRLADIRAHGLRYDEGLQRAEDYGFWADMLLQTDLKAANLPEALYIWRYFERPSTPVYHAKVAQRILRHLGLPDNELSAMRHTQFSCSLCKGVDSAEAEQILACADAVFTAVQRQGRIPMEHFTRITQVKAEKFLSRVPNALEVVKHYRALAMAKHHSLSRLLAMITLRKGYAMYKNLRQCVHQRQNP